MDQMPDCHEKYSNLMQEGCSNADNSVPKTGIVTDKTKWILMVDQLGIDGKKEYLKSNMIKLSMNHS